MMYVFELDLKRIRSTLQRVEGKLDKLLANQGKIMTKIDDDFARLTAQVKTNADTEDSAASVITAILQQLVDAKAQPDIGPAVDAVIAGLQAHQVPLAAAIASVPPSPASLT